MRHSVQFTLSDTKLFTDQVLRFSSSNAPVCQLYNNGFSAQNKAIDETSDGNSFDYLTGVGCLEEIKFQSSGDCFEQLKQFADENQDWLFGYLSYDLKNELENLKSENDDGVEIPVMHFFVPRFVVMIRGDVATVHFRPDHDSEETVKEWRNQVMNLPVRSETNVNDASVELQSKMSKQEYLGQVEALQEHIQRGDIYEVNFCQEFYAENVELDPVQTYLELNTKSPAPFSCYFFNGDQHVLSASPERYLKKVGSKIYTQPIKGTAKRGRNDEEDQQIIDQLKSDAKEISENVMIVDLCRNDLSRIAERNSVEVNELCEIYSFAHVHQMISTVSAKLDANKHFLDSIKFSFPMGSMTGAPKIRAMELIEKYEKTKRGLFSGAIGYFTPDRDFDFNVVIRSILYKEKTKYLSINVGGAITILSDPEKEFEECLLKAGALMNVLNASNG